MIYIDYIYKQKITNKYVIATKECSDKESALRFMYAMQNKGNIIDSWRCDDALDNEWISRRFHL